jgi:Carboxypeptidase regulatory-like domain
MNPAAYQPSTTTETPSAPTGSIAGVVRDFSGAPMAAVHVKILTTSTALARTIATSVTGDYSFPFLLAVEYEISVEWTV